ncbi:MAG: hypothetical protein IJY61_03965 [Candidatus Gastranaerophilales bacterium]|nr:hypothetical protein [Candidatus Gastranaerophilales bacterium]
MEFLKNNKYNILFAIIIIAYALIIFTTGYYHEPWADEAQAFIHARDYSVTELFFEKLKYEGHPIVWYLIIKFLLLFKFISSSTIYENLFVLTCLLQVFAVYLFLFKSKIPLLLKILIPFTFFIVYQYPVVARNHSIVFPLLAVLATFFYANRTKNPYIYSFLLIILANISAYTYTLSCVLSAFFLYDIWGKNKFKIKKYIPTLITGLSLFITALYLNKPKDCTFPANFNFDNLSIDELLYNLHLSFFNYENEWLSVVELCIVLIFYCSAARIFCQNRYQLTLFIAINLSVLFLQTVFYANDWHYGYTILFLIFSLWILTDKNNQEKITIKKHFLFIISAVTLLITQICWGLKSIQFDINGNYCASKAVTDYIKEEQLYNKDIAVVGFKSVALHPYFEQNIFYNLDKHSLSSWKKEIKEHSVENIKGRKPDILILPKENMIEFIYLAKGYIESKEYCGYLFSKGVIKENNCFLLYKLDNAEKDKM